LIYGTFLESAVLIKVAPTKSVKGPSPDESPASNHAPAHNGLWSHFQNWQERLYAFHDFSHELYTKHVLPSGPRHTQLPM
jgi:hypothetical protein